jgi:hypothetical protein
MRLLVWGWSRVKGDRERDEVTTGKADLTGQLTALQQVSRDACMNPWMYVHAGLGSGLR